MPRTVSPLLPSTQLRLRHLGERLRLARRRRGISAAQVAARAGMAPMTLRNVERGGAAATMGAYAAVMQVLGLDADLDLLAAADPAGRALQDATLSTPRARGARAVSSGDTPAPASRSSVPVTTPSSSPGRASADSTRGRAQASTVRSEARGVVTAEALARLLVKPRPKHSATRRR